MSCLTRANTMQCRVVVLRWLALLEPHRLPPGHDPGGLLARSVTGLSSAEMSTSATGMWLVFGGASAAIRVLNLFLLLWRAPRFPVGLSSRSSLRAPQAALAAKRQRRWPL